MSAVEYRYGYKNVLEFSQLWDNGNLNLEPGFQRQSVWSMPDRRKLIASVLDGYPIPSVFLYKRDENGFPVYDVLDGKQRLETIFGFIRASGFNRRKVELKYQFEGDDKPYWYDWSELKYWKLTSRVYAYRIQTVEVEGDLGDIIELFVRINSTGKALSGAEKNHAKYFASPLLGDARKLANKWRKYLMDTRIVSTGQIARMRDVELITELLVSIRNQGPVHKKAAIDRALGNELMTKKERDAAVAEFRATIKMVRKMFPELSSTRFRNRSEFYTLFMVVWDMRHRHLVLDDSKRRRLAQVMLTRLSQGVDEVRELQKQTKGAGPDRQLYASYLMTVQQSTDQLIQRRQRAAIIRGVLESIFERKDEKRAFSPEQRRLLWHSDAVKKCSQCHKKLNWGNFEVDHVHPHSKGGKTTLSNAALICRPCNASKGAKT